MKTALITGITGQDGHHLTSFLKSKNYEIVGLVNGQRNSKIESFQSLHPEVKLLRGDLADFASLLGIIDDSKPDEIYNLGAISFVGLSFKQPEITANITGLGTLRLLEAIKVLGSKNTRFYQASSSEMFGLVKETPQSEKTPFHPRSPYGVAKVFAHYTTQNYREAYDLFASSGILFNHEGEFRGHEFVTRKITSNLARIKLNKIKKFSLGPLTPKRDWGYSGDFVEAMWLILQHSIADDFVISTGESHSVKEFLLEAMDVLNLGDEIEKYVDFDDTQIRPAEVDTLIGDYSKANKMLGWKPKTNFRKLIEIMVENDLRIETNRNNNR